MSHIGPVTCGGEANMVVKAMWKLLDLCLPRKVVIKKQYRNPGRIIDISAIIKGLKGAELVIPTIFQIILPFVLCRRGMGSGE